MTRVLLQCDVVRHSTQTGRFAGVGGCGRAVSARLAESRHRRAPPLPRAGAGLAAKGPGRSFPLLSDLLKQLSERKELAVPDVDVAVIQLFSLTLYPAPRLQLVRLADR